MTGTIETRPLSVTIALWIIWLAAAAQIGCFAYAALPAPGSETNEVVILAQIITPALIPLILSAFMRKGANWPRFVYATLAVLTAPWTSVFLGWLGLLYFALFGAKAVSAVLLFLPSANAWFAPRRVSGATLLPDSPSRATSGLLQSAPEQSARISASRPLALKLAIGILSLAIVGCAVFGALDLDRSVSVATDPDAIATFSAFTFLLAAFLVLNILAASAILLVIWLGRVGACYVFATLLIFWLPLVMLCYGITNFCGALLTLALIAGTILLFHAQSRQWFETLPARATAVPSRQQPTASNA